MNIRPLGDRVLVEPAEEKEQMVGGIYIPDAAKEKPIKGKVLALGKKYDKDHKELAFDVKVGDTVPTWAAQSAANLTACGIACADEATEDALTRAEAADMLAAAMDLIEAR